MHFTPNQIVVSRFSPINTRMVVVAHLKSGVKVRKVDFRFPGLLCELRFGQAPALLL